MLSLLLAQPVKARGKFTCCINNDSEEVVAKVIVLTVIFSPEKKRLIRLYSKHREILPDLWPPVGAKTFINFALSKKKSQGTDACNYSGDQDWIKEKVGTRKCLESL